MLRIIISFASKVSFAVLSDFGKRLRSTGERFLADVGVAVAHGGADIGKCGK